MPWKLIYLYVYWTDPGIPEKGVEQCRWGGGRGGGVGSRPLVKSFMKGCYIWNLYKATTNPEIINFMKVYLRQGKLKFNKSCVEFWWEPCLILQM